MSELAWYVVGSLGALLTSFGFVPQVRKMWQTKSVKDISSGTFVQIVHYCPKTHFVKPKEATASSLPLSIYGIRVTPNCCTNG